MTTLGNFRRASNLRRVLSPNGAIANNNRTNAIRTIVSTSGNRDKIIGYEKDRVNVDVAKRSIFSSLHELLRRGKDEGRSSPEDKTSWQAEHNADIQRVTQNAIIHELTQKQTRTIEKVVPWFLETMPTAYFRQVPYDYRMDHIKAISAIVDANMKLHLNLTTPLPDGQLITFIRPGKKAGILSELLRELPWDHNDDESLPLSRLQLFTSNDDSMSLNMFIYGGKKASSSTQADLEEVGSKIIAHAHALQNGDFQSCTRHPQPSEMFEKDNLLEYLQQCNYNYIKRSDPRRFLIQRDLVDQVSGSEGTAIAIEESDMDDSHGQYWVDIAVANSIPQVALEHTSRLLYLHKFDVIRSHLDVVSDGSNGNVTLLRMLVNPLDNKEATKEAFSLIKKELKRVKWLDPYTMDLAIDRYPSLGIERGEIITALCSLMHPIMSKKNSFTFSKANILDTVTKERFIPHAAAIADLFLDRFNPDHPLDDNTLTDRSNQLREDIASSVEDSNAEELLNKMIDVVQSTLKTNVYLENRYSLALRLDPQIMVTEQTNQNDELPYGVIFTHGRRFNGYHVRFRDIARGGLRLVTPSNPEQFALESARQFDECYALAYAQQLKNKDIPEGGSKAVALIDVEGMSDMGKDYVMRKSVKAFADAILDLIVETDETRDKVVNLVGKSELIYLGPDEQVTSDDINWIVKRAAIRGYDTPAAFMSSKPRAGINHKEYGVTSEGVYVYLDVALRETLGIDPTKQSFTIKMTGGPDGDVAGNLIKILIREYGTNAKIVGIADHSGCAEDPNGLDHDELLRLVENNLSIGNFDDSKLLVDGALHLVDTEDGIKNRNSMHNRVVADAFVPAGGRPNTIDIHNCMQFMKEDGTPSSPLIVEGANLFVTEEARQALYDEAGVVIVKDSSANKCGVITSSYEICAAMLLSEDEFFDNKQVIVSEVLSKLRELAKVEAMLLFREFKSYPGSLPHTSKVVSNAINVTKDALSSALENMSDEEIDLLLPLFRAHLPKTLADLSFDRVRKNVPLPYIKNAISSCIASKMVYKEGTKFIEAQPRDRLGAVALTYIAKEKEMAKLGLILEGTDIPENEKRTIMELLDRGGARTALDLD